MQHTVGEIVRKRVFYVGNGTHDRPRRLQCFDQVDGRCPGRERAHDQDFHRAVLKYAIVCFKPSSSATEGAHPRADLARLMSGWRWRGSSWGRGLKAIFERLLVSATTF